MQDLTTLADILQRWQRLDAAVNDRCSTYSPVTLTAMRESMERLEQGVVLLRERLARRSELMEA